MYHNFLALQNVVDDMKIEAGPVEWFVPTKRGGRFLCYDGYMYRVNKKTENMKTMTCRINWRCTTKCCSSYVTTIDDVVCFDSLQVNSPLKASEKKVPCPICGMFLLQRRSLKRHFVAKHLNERVSCEFCGKKFTQTCNLHRHMKNSCPILLTSTEQSEQAYKLQ
ncbi:hypothetical protein LOTGIDRAFT_160732 [Lottia gigantea]|uniref:C2H2-type domain-containing protein n=1 Tax=Lottia gigantea TaxID=225164 RepID=V4C0K8_LOTGI|nr:hypothetical protein LOTGIDRAFT_160732 [Lottia gigantea]ESO94979.1 hypothetical protein LOTGIDRAFT_160732 [Lottia gigantea]